MRGRLAPGAAFHLQHHLPIIDLRHDKSLDAPRQLADEVFGERPGRDQLEPADLDALLARQLDRPQRHARGDAIRNHDHLGVVQSFAFHADNVGAIGANFFDQPVNEPFLHSRVSGQRVAALVVRQPGDVHVIALARARHRRNAIRVSLVWTILVTRHGRLAARIELERFGRGDDDALGHVAHRFIGHEEHRRAILFRKVERLDGQVKHLLRRSGAQRDDFVRPVAAPPRLHHVALPDQRRQTGARPAALDVDQHARSLGHYP